MSDELSAPELKELFLVVGRALVFDALRLKPREKQLAFLLASESFGEGSAFGAVDMDAWRLRLATWRSNELKDMLTNWRRAGWLTVDVTEQTFRLAPDRFPGWADVQAIQRSEERSVPLNLTTEDDLHKTFAKISQLAAAAVRPAVTKISQLAKKSQGEVAKSSQLGEGGNVKTFNRTDVKRLNVERSDAREPSCENFAIGEAMAGGDPALLMDRVRKFVGEADWTDEHFWNAGRGWRKRLFVEEAASLANALNYCQAGIATGETTIKKTRGAMLWNEFQRMRSQGQQKV